MENIKARYMTKDECRFALQNNQRVTSISALIDVAIEDAKNIDRSLYEADSGEWHSGLAFNAHCFVCVAGFVIAETLNSQIEFKKSPVYFPDNIDRSLLALDNLRVGNFKGAKRLLHLEYPNFIEDRFCTFYSMFKNWEEADLHLKHLSKISGKIREAELGNVEIPKDLNVPELIEV